MRFLNTNKKKQFIAVLFLFPFFMGVVFFVAPYQVNGCSYVIGAPDECGLVSGALGYVVGGAADYVGDGLVWAFKWILFGFFQLLGWLASVAITLFGWAVKPDYISGDRGLLNLQAIYTLWQFVRDFFNIFFIFALLYIAFTTVFQIQKNFKKAILTLVLAALFVNFSFPISRVLIDVTNVPMYFFANQMLGSDGSVDVLGSALSVSQLSGVLVPGSEKGGEFITANTTVSRLLAAIVFMFIFSVTLLVLAVMFVIRLVALVILVIFSSAGFVAFIVPGAEKYANMWWDNFWKYALFGPAAMLMLLIATRFFDAIGNKDGATFGGIKRVASDVASEPDFIASMAMFSIPIIMLWFAMSLGQKFSIAGAASISGKGEKFVKWMGKKTYDNPLGRGLGGGIKERAENNKYAKVLTPKFWKGPSSTEAVIKGGIVGVGTDEGMRGGARNELERIRYKKALDDAEEYKKNRMAHSEAREKMAKGDVGAALYLAGDKGLSTGNDLVTAAKLTGHDRDMLSRVMNGAQDSAVVDLTDKQHAAIQEAFYEIDSKTGKVLRDQKDPNERRIDSTKQEAYSAYTTKLKKEGRLDIRINHEIQARVDDTGIDRDTARDQVYGKRIATLDAEDLIKQTDLHKGTTGADLMTYYKSAIDKGEVSAQRIQKTIDKAVEKGKPEVQKVWIELGGSIGKRTSKTPREIAEEEFAKATKNPIG